MQNTLLQTPIDYLKGVGPGRAEVLRKELGISTYQDLINLFPNRYIDRTRFYKVSHFNLPKQRFKLWVKLQVSKNLGRNVANA